MAEVASSSLVWDLNSTSRCVSQSVSQSFHIHILCPELPLIGCEVWCAIAAMVCMQSSSHIILHLVANYLLRCCCSKSRQKDSPEDFQDYLDANPCHRSAVGPIFFQLYRQLDLIRFYTVDKISTSEDEERVREVKIWFCQQGTYAPEAAGRILTDMERYKSVFWFIC